MPELPDVELYIERLRPRIAGAALEGIRIKSPFLLRSVDPPPSACLGKRVPDSYETVMACDKDRFNRFFHAMLDAGVYLAPSAFEAGFVSAAHTDDEIAQTIVAAERAFASI